jgi:hypothetical protein
MEEPETLASKTVYDGKMITVARDVVRQDNSDVIREVVGASRFGGDRGPR